jgi:GTP cyclohydrolase I
MDRKKIEKGVELILEAVGEDTQREGLKKTPTRVAELYQELFSGIEKDPKEEIELYSFPQHDEMIVAKDIAFCSFCEHHLLPFFGKAHIVYVPDNNRITGFSRLARVVEVLAHRPQLQERLTSQVADVLSEVLKPRGVLVILEAEQLCLTVRGIKKPGVGIVTSASRGVLKDEKRKAFALSLIKDKNLFVQ